MVAAMIPTSLPLETALTEVFSASVSVRLSAEPVWPFSTMPTAGADGATDGAADAATDAAADAATDAAADAAADGAADPPDDEHAVTSNPATSAPASQVLRIESSSGLATRRPVWYRH